MRAARQPGDVAPERTKFGLAGAGGRAFIRRMDALVDPVRKRKDVQALFAHLAGERREVIGVAYLDADWRVLGLRHGPVGSATAADVPLRAIARDVVAFGAARVVMAHNHPSGDPTPSPADIRVTRRVARALAALGAPLVEHLILARGGHVSLDAAGIV